MTQAAVVTNGLAASVSDEIYISVVCRLISTRYEDVPQRAEIPTGRFELGRYFSDGHLGIFRFALPLDSRRSRVSAIGNIGAANGACALIAWRFSTRVRRLLADVARIQKLSGKTFELFCASRAEKLFHYVASTFTCD